MAIDSQPGGYDRHEILKTCGTVVFNRQLSGDKTPSWLISSMIFFGGWVNTYYDHIWGVLGYHIITILLPYMVPYYYHIYIYYIHKPAVTWASVWALGFWQKGPYTNLRDDGGLWTRLYFGLWLTPGRESYLIWLVVWDIWIIFPYIGNVIIPTEFHIFQMGSNHQPVHQHLSSQKKRFTGVNLHTHRNQHG